MLNKRNWDVYKFCSKDESRFTLQAIQVTPDATIATDGHRLVWVSSDGFKSESFPVVPSAAPSTDSFPPFLVSGDLAAKLSKATPTKEIIPVLNRAAVGIDGDRRTITVTDLESPQVFDASKQPEGKFPDFNAVVPRWDKATTRFCVNAKYLADIAAFVASMDKRPVSVVVSVYGDENVNALRLDAECEGQGVTAVLMPTRSHCTRDDRTWKQKEQDQTPFHVEWTQPVNTFGYVKAVTEKAEAEAAFELMWDAAHAEEIERAWELAQAEEITRNDAFANTKSFEEVRFTVALMGEPETEAREPEPEPESTTLYVNVTVSDAFVGKLETLLNVEVAQGHGRFINVYSTRPAVIGHAIRELSMVGIVVTEVSPKEHAPEGFIPNATPRQRVKQGIPVNVTDLMPKAIDARPIPSKPNQSVIDAANSF